MLDNILNSVRRGAERVQRRGEEVAQVTKLRVEVFQLTREQDGLFARLGRSYHAGADEGVLADIQIDIRRVDEEISARERLIQELNTAAAEPEDSSAVVRQEDKMQATTAPTNTVQFGAAEPTIPDAMPRPSQSQPSNPVQISKEAQPMTQNDDKPTSITTNPTVNHSDEKLIPAGETASAGDEAGRDKLYRRPHHLEEAENASKHPDPLDM